PDHANWYSPSRNTARKVPSGDITATDAGAVPPFNAENDNVKRGRIPPPSTNTVPVTSAVATTTASIPVMSLSVTTMLIGCDNVSEPIVKLYVPGGTSEKAKDPSALMLVASEPLPVRKARWVPVTF